MSSSKIYSEYDALANAFDRTHKVNYDVWVELMEKLLLQYLPKEAHILDLCCGTGPVAQRLLLMGYQVTGLDGSEEMLNLARQKAPSVKFLQGDARFFKFTSRFNAVISLASLMYILSIEELTSVFQNMYDSLLENGFALFDLIIKSELEIDENEVLDTVEVKDDFVSLVTNSYNQENKLEQKHTILQLINANWQRFDVSFTLKTYSIAEVISTLEKTGFIEVKVYNAEQDLGLNGGSSRACFVCRKPN
ncbi:class I SAM-dependent DNA methyltransferase [Nostoc punctiforme]|uniref:Methyltransferase type 11 n=1 Tax=Nostoc punctiforme (strain ATCC 29133 / PCC 73102) TaxID=63737 RepID=B2J105_NOSP7|nr:class I SAM-dependent methyltransferase [Nostoc punctiforme]ACC81856.1 Methyltransferase type 11 [Nostoc punctiforme PCC 73102]